MPGLVVAAKRNRAHNMNDAALFEVGQSYGGTEPEDQYISAAGMRFGQNDMSGSGRHWAGNVEAY